MVFGLSTLWEGLHYGQGRKCDSQLLRQPSRWSHPSGEPVKIILVIMIIIIFRIIIVICSAPSCTLSWISSYKSSFHRPPRLFLLLDSPSLGQYPLDLTCPSKCWTAKVTLSVTACTNSSPNMSWTQSGLFDLVGTPRLSHHAISNIGEKLQFM